MPVLSFNCEDCTQAYPWHVVSLTEIQLIISQRSMDERLASRFNFMLFTGDRRGIHTNMDYVLSVLANPVRVSLLSMADILPMVDDVSRGYSLRAPGYMISLAARFGVWRRLVT